MTYTYDWIFSIPGGHRYFTEVETGRLTLADESGRTPDETDDGVLYIDQQTIDEVNHGIELIDDHPGSGLRGSIPLLDIEGNSTSTGGSLEEILALAEHLETAVYIKLRDERRAYVELEGTYE